MRAGTKVEKKAENSCADLKGFAIPSVTGERMYACFFKPYGDGPRPTVLLLHGYPGDENNYDLAHAFQRAGYSTVIFHYRGTWGSEGLFSLSHVLEDVSSALDFIRNHSGENTYQFDADRLVLIGHSMGGFAALETAANTSGLLGVGAIAAFDFSLAAENSKLRDAIRQEFSNYAPVRRIELGSLINEIGENAEKWNFSQLADKLSNLPVCLIGAAHDMISVPKYHLFPLRQSLDRIQNPGITFHMLDDGHCLSGTRIELADLLLDWTDGLLNK
ncbi:alpha/beta fold hydrolase [Caproiciproducens sp. NJN-50]|uniref:alpha/beta hydrolase family protein n=1 Tax=Acutalibacteraceae TaxID=3082771 RepID=UPI000FFE0035|nr:MULTISPECIES: alpha/beta fold hydrolase [Acutalibacteraceae]QAT50422.1 alpha/beta fold hydrolase [Caproiciproducens sp. NJN-50]